MVSKQYNESPEVIWIGSRSNNTIVVPHHLKSKKEGITFYERCIVGPLTLNVGDFVLIANADSAEPDSIDGCDIGRILNLYEQREMLKKDPYRAFVQWYSWPNKVPAKAFDSDDIHIDFDLEIIEEHRPYDADISLETVFNKCIVVHGDIENSAEDILKSYKDTKKKLNFGPMFVCRYKFIKCKKSYRLVPLQYVDESASVAASNDTKRIRTRRKSCVGGIENVVSKSGGSSSARKRRGTSALTDMKHRRASVASINAMEFIDVNKLSNENKVSPIKIIGGRSIVRLSASGKKQGNDKNNDKKFEVNANYLRASPLAEKNIKVTPTSRASAARRNLNLSLDDEGPNTTNDSDCFNYSIVEESRTEGTPQPNNEIKIKLRLSESNRSSRPKSVDEDPLKLGENAENALLQRQRKRLGIKDNSLPNNDYICHTPSKRSKETEIVQELAPSSQRKRLGIKDYSPQINDYVCHTPSKRSKEAEVVQELTPSTRRKSILKSASRIRDEGTPRRSIQLSNIVEQRVFQEDEIITTPKRNRTKKQPLDAEYTPSKLALKTPTRSNSSTTKQCVGSSSMTPSAKLKLLRSGEITPSIESRRASVKGHSQKSELQLARERLHVSVVPQSLPCREKEFDNIYTFLEGKIQDQCGGCMYVSGVPGTGKTATVTGVIRSLQEEAAAERLPEFEFLEINGMRLTEPRQAYVQIYKQLTGKTVSWEHAHALLDKRFTQPAPRRITTVLLVDELDILCNRRQDVVYNLLDWPTKSAARLVVITIANTMDLPERLLLGKVTSRLGLTRLTFQPYTHKQLQEIVTARLMGSDAFKGDAVQLVARKVAAVSGDARRALDICRRSTEIADAAAPNTEGHKVVNMLHVQQALGEMIASAKVQAIKNCSRLEQIFLQAVAAEVTRTGVEECLFLGVYSQVESIAAFMGTTVPTPGRALRICSKLGAERLLICEHSRNDIFQKILLNVSMDDIHYALRVNNNLS